MSSVTSVIMIAPMQMGTGLKKIIEYIQTRLDDDSDDFITHKGNIIEVEGPGPKGIWSHLFVISMNYCHWGRFVKMMKEIRWDYPEQIQLMYHIESSGDVDYAYTTVKDLK